MNLRQALRKDRPLLGTFVMLPRIEVLEMVALAGFDVAILDLEHGPFQTSDLPELAAAAQGAGMFVVARLGDSSETTIGNVLDAGVDGVLVPHVFSDVEAMRVVRAGRYPPAGNRSLNPYVRGTRYG
ncbi:MAG: aldolase/citrate lyase family protein, partial [Actinomycetota bacterium]